MGKIMRSPLMIRIKYAFTGYMMRNFLTTLRKKAPKYILIIVLALSTIYSLIHPIHKIQIWFILTRSCTIEKMVKGNEIISYKTTSEQLIDGDWSCSKGEYHSYYYKMEDGVKYRYYQDEKGEWQRRPIEPAPDSEIDAALLDASNYERAGLFVWKLKDEIANQIDDVTNIRVTRVAGCISIVGDYYSGGKKYEVVTRFKKFGITRVTPPVED